MIGTTDPDQSHYCSSFCLGAKKPFALQKLRPIKKPKRVVERRIKRSEREYLDRKSALHRFKAQVGLSDMDIAKELKVDRATVSCYLTGRYNISDKRWAQIQEMMG